MPPLTAIEAFIQVGRLGSVKAAAEELALSSPALSRRLQAMERFVGRSLFDRRHQAMALNAEGEALLTRIGPALDALAVAIGEATGDAEHLRLRLNVQPLWASQQLMPRMDSLREAYPDFHLNLDTAPHGIARLGDGLDAAIVLGREVDPALYSRRISRHKVVAIASRAMAAEIAGPMDLASRTILVHRDMADLFFIWRRGMDAEALEPAVTDHFDAGQLMLDAAAQGIGIAFMLDEHLAQAHNNQLVALFPERQVESGYSFWFACRRSAMSRRAVRIFHDWLIKAMATPAG
nr:LysR substrate-binding domain-containing protein [Sphingomonas quercus]